MHQTTDWLAARQLPDKCLEPGAKQLLSLALGHLAVRVEAAMMTAPPGLRAGGNDEKFEDLKRAKRVVLLARPEAQPETRSPSPATAWDCSRLYCHPASASCKMQLVRLLQS